MNKIKTKMKIFLCIVVISFCLGISGIAYADTLVSASNAQASEYFIDVMGLSHNTHSFGQVFQPTMTGPITAIKVKTDAAQYGDTVYLKATLWDVDQLTHVPTHMIDFSNTVPVDLYDNIQDINTWTTFHIMGTPTLDLGKNYAFIVTYSDDLPGQDDHQSTTLEVLYGINHYDAYPEGCALFGYTDDSVGYQPNTNYDLHFEVLQVPVVPEEDGIIIAVTIPEAAVINGTEINAAVGKSVKSLKVDVTVSNNATWELFKDKECKKVLSDKVLKLHTGSNESYIRVTGGNGQSKLYTLNVIKDVKDRD